MSVTIILTSQTSLQDLPRFHLGTIYNRRGLWRLAIDNMGACGDIGKKMTNAVFMPMKLQDRLR